MLKKKKKVFIRECVFCSKVVCCGAEQNGLPDDYVGRLQAVKTNNYMGPSMLDRIQMHDN